MRSSLASISCHFNYPALPAAKTLHTKTLLFDVIVVAFFYMSESLVVKHISEFHQDYIQIMSNGPGWMWSWPTLIYKKHIRPNPYCGINNDHTCWSHSSHFLFTSPTYLFTVSFIQSSFHMKSLLKYETNLPRCKLTGCLVQVVLEIHSAKPKVIDVMPTYTTKQSPIICHFSLFVGCHK